MIAALRPLALALSFLLPVALCGGAPASAAPASAAPASATPASAAPASATPASAAPASAAPSASSPRLKNAALASPMPKGWLGGWGGDTGLDIAGDHLEVFALAAGTLDYSEWGHTRWTTGKDTAFSVRLALDEPIAWKAAGAGDGRERRITHVYYTHLSKLDNLQREGSENRKHVGTGERIGVSGIGNGTAHLHLGLLLDSQVEQDSWEFILREHEVRKVLGDYKNGTRLP